MIPPIPMPAQNPPRLPALFPGSRLIFQPPVPYRPYRADVPLVPARPMLKRAPSAILPGSPDVKKARRPVAPEHHPKQVQPLVGKPKPGPHVKALHRPAAAAMKKGSGVKKASPSPREGRFSEDHVPCVSCGTRNTPQWRRGPDGELNMCNACGVRLRKGTLRRK